MKKLLTTALLSLGILSATPTNLEAQSVPRWFGSTNWQFVSACIYDGPTNARLTPKFENNVRAQFTTNSCGTVRYVNNSPVYENGFYLIRFYVHDLGEWRQYWIHETQLNFYL